jgi:superfamily I DNA/RNA helicase
MIPVEAWRPIAGVTLEPNAMSAAITIGDNVVLTAGPGAGKTELLAQRADFLLRTGTCTYPRRILAISFKVDAARNLRERVYRRSGRRLASRMDSFTFHAFAKRLIDNYRVALTGQNALDPDYTLDPDTRVARHQITYADLVPLAIEILQTNAFARNGLRQTYSHVFLDEFQDATNAQYQLVREAFLGTETRLTAVGDTKQRIMAWAGALEGVMQTCADDFEATRLTLFQNFRSAPRLRRMQNLMVAEMEPGAESPPEDLVGEEGAISTMRFDDDEDEAAGLADLIEGWLGEGVPPHEIAVLVRQQPSLISAALMDNLATRGIPCRNDADRQDLAAEPAAALVLNFLRVVAQDRQPEAYRAMMEAVAGAAIDDETASRNASLTGRFLSAARKQVRATGFASWRDLVDRFLDIVTRTALMAMSPTYQQGARLDVVLEEVLTAFEAELAAASGDAGIALARLSDLDAVRILTIHKSKGLEFEKVIVQGVENELFWGNNRAELKSVFFVAISRAKKELVLTTADFRGRPAGWTRFWTEQRTPHAGFLNYAEVD